MLIWWTIPLAVVAAALYFLLTFRKTHARAADGGRGSTTGSGGSGAVRIGLGVLGAVVGIGTLVQVVLIGHSGAESVWKGGDSAASVSVTLPLAG